MRRRFTGPLLASLILIATSTPPASRAAEPFAIDAIISETGYAAFLGRAQVKGLRIAEASIDAAGGVAGRPVTFVVHDDQSNPQVAVELANALLAKGAAAILGPSLVSTCQAIQPLIKGKAIEFCLSAGFHPAPDSYGFTQGVTALDQLSFSVRYLRETGIRKIALLASSDANGQDAEQGLELALKQPENRGVTLVADVQFNPTDLTIDAQMARVKASGAQAVINYNTGTPFGTVLHAYNDVGMDIPLVTNSAALSYAVVDQFAGYLPRKLLISGLIGDAPEVAPRGAVRAAVDTYDAAVKAADVEPDHLIALTWDPAEIIVAAYGKLGTAATGLELEDFIGKLHGWVGMNGVYDFRVSPSGLTARSIVMVTWNSEKHTFVAVSRPGGSPLSAGG